MINYAPGSSIRVGAKRYELKQFHFHKPSEEKINGKAYDMVIHLVHTDQEGHLAVVAVLLEEGKANPLVDELWKDLPKEKEREETAEGVEINAADLLPSDRGYFTFDGSLTTPPCTEHVTWFVLKQPLQVSAAEIARFARVYRHDARPTQPLYDRVVLESK
jgi:carbonic anhydrase